MSSSAAATASASVLVKRPALDNDDDDDDVVLIEEPRPKRAKTAAAVRPKKVEMTPEEAQRLLHDFLEDKDLPKVCIVHSDPDDGNHTTLVLSAQEFDQQLRPLADKFLASTDDDKADLASFLYNSKLVDISLMDEEPQEEEEVEEGKFASLQEAQRAFAVSRVFHHWVALGITLSRVSDGPRFFAPNYDELMKQIGTFKKDAHPIVSYRLNSNIIARNLRDVIVLADSEQE